MPISGLILTLQKECTDPEQVRAQARAHPAVEVGERSGIWLPAVIDAADDEESRRVHEWLSGLPHVAQVDVVYVSFDEEPAAV